MNCVAGLGGADGYFTCGGIGDRIVGDRGWSRNDGETDGKPGAGSGAERDGGGDVRIGERFKGDRLTAFGDVEDGSNASGGFVKLVAELLRDDHDFADALKSKDVVTDDASRSGDRELERQARAGNEVQRNGTDVKGSVGN